MKVTRVLVVDDEEIIRSLFKRLLGLFDKYTVVAAGSGSEALEIIRKENFHVAFITVIMPEMDGIALLKEIKKINPELPCVMMTGFAVEDKIREAIKLNAIDYLYKPFAMREISAVISKIEKKDTLKPLEDKKISGGGSSE